MTKEDIIRKLCSRKFWVALSGFVAGLLIFFGETEAQAAQITALIMSGASILCYILGESFIDAARENGDSYYMEPEEKPPEEN